MKTITFHQRRIRPSHIEDLEDTNTKVTLITLRIDQIESISGVIQWNPTWCYMNINTRTGQAHKAWSKNATEFAQQRANIVAAMENPS